MTMVAPLISLLINSWALSNRQMFENKIGEIQTQGEIAYSYHILGGKNNPTFTHTTILYYGFIALLLGLSVFAFM